MEFLVSVFGGITTILISTLTGLLYVPTTNVDMCIFPLSLAAVVSI